ncbi:MAG: Polysaccharide biosynthesis/export protein [Chthoniobacteraceae bacterium]|nr:Polysaccharide biosynthesis/export protein [Chthoniobacteraceae bacterium]
MKIPILYLFAIATLVCISQSYCANSADNYVLRGDDLVEIKVFQEDDLTTRVRIPSDGQISFPLIGSLRVGSRTVREAEDLIRKELGERFLVHPQVNLSVLEYARTIFTVIGQVQRPGTYKFPDRSSLNLVQAIGIAGGYTRIADTTRITLKRRTGGKELVQKLDAKRMAKENTTVAFEIKAGDIITVGERIF